MIDKLVEEYFWMLGTIRDLEIKVKWDSSDELVSEDNSIDIDKNFLSAIFMMAAFDEDYKKYMKTKVKGSTRRKVEFKKYISRSHTMKVKFFNPDLLNGRKKYGLKNHGFSPMEDEWFLIRGYKEGRNRRDEIQCLRSHGYDDIEVASFEE